MMEDVSDGKTKAHGRRLRGGREKMVLTPPSSESSTVKTLKHQESKRNHVTLYSSASISPHLTSVAKCMQPKQKTAHPCQPSTPAAQPTQSLPTRYRRNTTCLIPALPCQVL